MMECTDLFLDPWLAVNGATSRNVLNLTNDFLGSIRRSSPRWWPRRPRFEIREGDDHSLLFCVSPGSWPSRRWLVHDADELLLGVLIRPSPERSIQLLSPANSPLAELSWIAAKTAARAISPRGTCLLDIDCQTARTRITFAPEADPFSRMILLGASLLAGA